MIKTYVDLQNLGLEEINEKEIKGIRFKKTLLLIVCNLI